MNGRLPVLKTYFNDSIDPFKEFNSLQKDLDQIFNDVFGNWNSPRFTLLKGSYPKVNVKENEKGFEIIAATPGLTKEDLSIDYKEGILSIKGESKQDDLDKDDKFLCRELKKSSFIRSFQLDESTLDIEKIKSIYENGELRVTIPKKKEVIERRKSRKIKID